MSTRVGAFFGMTACIIACSSTTANRLDQPSDGGTTNEASGAGSGGDGSSVFGSGADGSAGDGSGSAGSDSGTGTIADATARDALTPDSGPGDGNAAGDGASQTLGGDASTACAACAGGEVCVEDQTVGGAQRPPDDAGQCPAGLVIVPEAPGTCSSPPTFHCAPLPSTCNTAPGSTAVAHCVCAPSLCSAGRTCTDLTPTLMRCLLAAP